MGAPLWGQNGKNTYTSIFPPPLEPPPLGPPGPQKLIKKRYEKKVLNKIKAKEQEIQKAKLASVKPEDYFRLSGKYQAIGRCSVFSLPSYTNLIYHYV